MAISTNAKAFLASPVTQKVVNDIYSGRVVFSVMANRSILADNYKHRAIEIYTPHNAPFLDHYRCVLFSIFRHCRSFLMVLTQASGSEIWGLP
jgi:hypothetical protein